jgi:predicted O-methyltransferase YrrM
MKYLIRAIGRKLANFGQKSEKRDVDYRWEDPQSKSDAFVFLYRRIKSAASKQNTSKIIFIGNDREIEIIVGKMLGENYSVSYHQKVNDFLESSCEIEENLLIGVASFDASEIHQVASDLVVNEATRYLSFEFAVVPKLENQVISTMWENSENFISPLHLQKVNWKSLFEESCHKFDPKTGIRDFMDLIQCLSHIVEKNIPGNIAEFGSFKGQSGYLIARFLELMKSDKKLYMFDMFESFPTESIGIDHFWSNTHEVDYSSIKNKFSDMKNVQLVKGDFTQTLEKIDTGKLALAFVDCDSYRGTEYLIKKIFDYCLAPSGLMLFEDYGHASLLGNRLAVHKLFDRKKNAFCFFSQFSGTYIVCKTH